MKRILTIICAIAFSSASLSAQNNADTIRVNRNGAETLVIIVKEKQSSKKEQRLAEKAQRPAYMVNVGNTEVIMQTLNSHGLTNQYGVSPHHTDSVLETGSMSVEVRDSVQNSQMKPQLWEA